MKKPQLTAINPKDIDLYWSHVRHLIEPAIGYSNYDTAEDVYKALKEQRAYLWIVHTGDQIDVAAVMQLKLSKKRGKIFTIWALGAQGNKIWKWLRFIKDFEAFAEREGCALAIHDLRPEWVQIMCKKFGYRMTHATIEKVI